MVEKTDKTGEDKATKKPGQGDTQPGQAGKESPGFDPVGSVGKKDGQDGRPDAHASPDDADKGKPFQDQPKSAQ